MKKINSRAELKLLIQTLESDHAEKGQLLKNQINITFESLKPANLLRSTLNDISSTPYLMENVMGAVMGLSTGYLTRKMIVGKSSGIIKKIFGSLMQFGVTNIVAQHSETIQTFGQSILQSIFTKKKIT